MRGVRTIGLAAASLAVLVSAQPTEAGCIRAIVNRSTLYAAVSRDGGPWVMVPPNASQSIRLEHPGRVEVALSCAPPDAGPDSTVYRNSFTFQAVVDRCYYQFGDGFFRDYLGGGFFGFRDTGPLSLNNPRQGDLVVGPKLNGACPYSEPLRSRY